MTSVLNVLLQAGDFPGKFPRQGFSGGFENSKGHRVHVHNNPCHDDALFYSIGEPFLSGVKYKADVAASQALYLRESGYKSIWHDAQIYERCFAQHDVPSLVQGSPHPLLERAHPNCRRSASKSYLGLRAGNAKVMGQGMGAEECSNDQTEARAS